MKTLTMTMALAVPVVLLCCSPENPPNDANNGTDAIAADNMSRVDAVADGVSEMDIAIATDAADSGVAPADALLPNDAGNADGDLPRVSFTGRFDSTSPSQPIFEWSASTITARFSGTQASVTLNVTTSAYFEVLIDGQLQPVIQATTGSSSYPLATGLPAGVHDVVIVKRDEAQNGPVQFQGFDFGPTGALLPPPSRPSRRLELIGDSITAGYGNECANGTGDATGAQENQYLAYGSVAARDVQAEIHVEAQSGVALSFGSPPMPGLWLRTIRSDPNSTYDFSSWIPDAVVINLGSNDWFAGGDPTAAFEAAYLSFLSQIRGIYPNAYIFCAIGPMLTGSSLTQARAAIQSVVATRNTSGDARVSYLEFPMDTYSEGFGCAGHPNVAEDAAMAMVLEQALQQQLGW